MWRAILITIETEFNAVDLSFNFDNDIIVKLIKAHERDNFELGYIEDYQDLRHFTCKF